MRRSTGFVEAAKPLFENRRSTPGKRIATDGNKGQVLLSANAICHGRAGDGQGVVSTLGVGMSAASLHDASILKMPDGQLYRTIAFGSKEGQGVMKGYKTQLNVADRWAVVAYVRALQYSRLVGPEELKEIYGKEPDSVPAAE